MLFFKWLNDRGWRFPLPKWLLRAALVLQSGTRGASIGIRAIIFDDVGRVFLARHSYINGWYLPGGGVERKEAPKDALVREMLEEAQMRAMGTPNLYGFYLNDRAFTPDYIALYVVRDWEWASEGGDRSSDRSEDGEICEAGFFEIADLPNDISPATRRRIHEVTTDKDPAQFW